MFTLDEILAVQPANSPIGDGAYWLSVLAMAERRVKSICGRELESASYTDAGYLLPSESANGKVYVWYLREPTGTAIDFANLTDFTLDDATVDSDDVTIEAARLIFNGGGHVQVTYPGGYLRSTEATAVIKQAVVRVMHEIHRTMQEGGQPDFQGVKEDLAPYRVGQFVDTGTKGPD